MNARPRVPIQNPEYPAIHDTIRHLGYNEYGGLTSHVKQLRSTDLPFHEVRDDFNRILVVRRDLSEPDEFIWLEVDINA